VGAGLAFQAASERYGRQDFVALTYHVHIPQPDPMVNPSTLKRQTFYAVRGVPSYSIDGESSGGGGSAESSKSIFDAKVEPVIQKKLAVAPEARIGLRATSTGPTITVKASVSKVASKSDKLRLQVALVEESVRFSGENGVRFHGMVVRSMAEPAPPPAPKTAEPAGAAAAKPGEPAAAPAQAQATGFALKPGKGGTFEHTFDLAAIAVAAKAHLEDFETNTRKGQYAFREKKHEMDPARLCVVAFVQDEASKKILQAVYVKPLLKGARTN
jgi:hypothetical protein